MRNRLMVLVALLVMAAAMFSLASCSRGEKETVGTRGGAVVNTYTASATVTGIDAANRKLELTLPDGKRTTVKAGPEVRNFDQIQVNDRLNVTMTEELAVFVGKGAPPMGSGSAVAVAPIGAKPGAVMADRVQASAKITAIDAKDRKVTFQLEDGNSKVLKVGKKADLSNLKPGDTVTVQYTEALAIAIEKP